MVASLAYRKSFDRRPRYPFAFFRTRLRRARLAGELVALGMLFWPELLPTLLFQRAVAIYYSERLSKPRALIIRRLPEGGKSSGEGNREITNV
jgi:hypothetical protein